MSEGKTYLKTGEGTPEQIAEYKMAFAMVQSPDWEKNSIPKVQAGASYTSEAKVLALETALRTAIIHIEHMAAWIAARNVGYSFESLGEDMPGIKAALTTPLRFGDSDDRNRGETSRMARRQRPDYWSSRLEFR